MRQAWPVSWVNLNGGGLVLSRLFGLLRLYLCMHNTTSSRPDNTRERFLFTQFTRQNSRRKSQRMRCKRQDLGPSQYLLLGS